MNKLSIKNNFKDGELDGNSTCAIFAQMGNDEKSRPIQDKLFESDFEKMLKLI